MPIPYTRSPRLFYAYLDALVLKSRYQPWLPYFLLTTSVLSFLLIIFVSLILPIGWLLLTIVLLLPLSLFCLTSFLICYWIFGEPVMAHEVYYQDDEYQYKTATAKIVVNNLALPRLSIDAETHYDAGFVEGYLLGWQIKPCLQRMDKLYRWLRILLGMPKKESDIYSYIIDVEKTIPNQYIEEMKGKVAGFKKWCEDHGETRVNLSYERYFLLHLIPDFHHYNPFKSKSLIQLSMGCSTVAFKKGEDTVLMRMLDWPSYGIAGQYILQVNRCIANEVVFSDISLPLLSGVLTAFNQHGLMLEMNVSRAFEVQKPLGMPALFFNRYCITKAKNITELKLLFNSTDSPSPLSAYHLTATDGVEVLSCHFYLSAKDKDQHDIEFMPAVSTTLCQNMVVVNKGLSWQGHQSTPINHRDSEERLKNIDNFLQQKLATPSDEHLGQHFKDICYDIAALPMVNNCESVLCAIFHYHQGKLISVSAAKDNHYVGFRKPSEYMALDLDILH